MLRSLILVALPWALCVEPAAGHGHANAVARHRAAARPSIALAGRVTDAAHLLEVPEKASLDARLVAFEQATGHQLVVVTTPTLKGQDIAVFTRQLANAWGIGRAKYNDGIVVLVAPNERKVRIAVGRGLERRLTNAKAFRIIGAEMLPRFTNGDLPGGIEAGVSAIIRELSDVPRGESLPRKKVAADGCPQSHFASGGRLIRIASTLPPVFSPKVVPRS